LKRGLPDERRGTVVRWVTRLRPYLQRRVDFFSPRAHAPRFAFGAAGIGGWLAASYALAATGALRNFSAAPPPLLILIATATLLTTALAFSRWGRRLVDGIPAAALVGFQAFRIPVEWFLDRLYREGVVPVQMTFEGRNFDIASGITALAVAAVCARSRTLPRGLVLVWSALGTALLIHIVAIAATSAPGPLRLFHDDPPNTFVASAPFVWLPAFLVQAAWLGHLLVFRRCAELNPLPRVA
jgi:hypothetical protein